MYQTLETPCNDMNAITETPIQIQIIQTCESNQKMIQTHHDATIHDSPNFGKINN